LGKEEVIVRDDLQFVLRWAHELPPEQLPRLLGDLEEIRCTAVARLGAPPSPKPGGLDQLVAVGEAAQRIGTSKDYLYRHSGELPFTKRIGRKLLFSSAGIERYIRQQDGLAKRHA
jgi:excisionase family DNA binding protein